MNLKDRIFDLLEGTYGLDAAAIAERLSVSVAEIRRAVDEMLDEDRLWETSEDKYRCVLPPPPWLDAVKESLGCEGWPGLSYCYVPEDFHLELFPIPFIREGDEDGGICFMIDWNVDLNPLLELFDPQPAVVFGSSGQCGTHFTIEGTINGVDAWVEILDRPPVGLPPSLLMTTGGGFRELTEVEQEEYEATYTGEQDDDDDDEQPPLRGLWTPSDN